MTSKIVFLESQWQQLRSYLFDKPGIEGAAFVLCGESQAPRCKKLLAHAVVPVAPEDYLRREALGLTITSRALSRITKLARHEKLSIVFAHSHPEGFAEFSAQDDREEERLLPFIQSRLPDRVHGTLVLTRDGAAGRLYLPSKTEVDQVLVVGKRFEAYPRLSSTVRRDIFDRQIRAFGSFVQERLRSMTIGVVGAGGTGSAIAEQLCRLGVGTLYIFDGERLELSNLNRVYGSTVADADRLKVDIARDHLKRIALQTEIQAVPKHITNLGAASVLRECDVVFGCTDKHLPRAILTQLSLTYFTPVIDLGVLIDSSEGIIRGVHGRVTTLMPGEACLFCRGRISPEAIRVEALTEDELLGQIADGYAPELEEPAPSVIPFTSAVASTAVAELLHRLTGFMGSERHTSEVLHSFDETRIRTNRVSPREVCICTDQSRWGRGDEDPFLGMVWPTDTK